MMWYFSTIISLFSIVWGFFWCISSWEAATTYSPGSTIAMTGSNGEVFFDVTDDLFGYPIPRPSFDTMLGTFSWAFYLSWAGWVDFLTGSYSVALDCGAQSYDALTLPCTLSWVAYGEIVGDVLFDRQVLFDPTTWRLSGTASTYIWVYDFSGITLPLLPASFVLGNRVTADNEKDLSLSGMSLYGDTVWNIFMETSPGGMNISYTVGLPTDLSHATTYYVEIHDPDGGVTTIDDFEVVADQPSSVLYSATPTIRADFCTNNFPSLLCPDGTTLKAMTLDRTETITPMIANGVDMYNFVLKLRDRYGNEVREGSIKVDYTDMIRTIQADPLKYNNLVIDACSFGTCAIISQGDLQNFFDGVLTTGDVIIGMSDINFDIASIAPSTLTDTITLSGILYTDTFWVSHDVTDPTWRAPLVFDPWYTTSILPIPSIVVWSVVDFTTNYARTTSAIPPNTPTAIYDIAIGSNNPAAFTGFVSAIAPSCTKYYLSSGVDECDWGGTPDPVMISTESLSFSGIYWYGGYEPPPENINYNSYIRYSVLHPLLGTNVVSYYPSGNGSLWISNPGAIRMKILGQHNLPGLSWIQEKNIADIWNTLQKNIALMSRNRTTYADVPYSVTEGDISISDTDFTSTSPEKRTIVSLGWDITITSDIIEKTSPIAIIALSDTDGNGGNIIIDPSVTDIHATLLAERVVSSTGSNQLYIHGSVISHNTTSDSTCPYYISPCANPELYNLENLRKDFIITPGSLASSLSGKYPNIPLIIEYDGRVISDPPPILEQ